ncbi:MAG: hypothetical protein ACYC63_19480 [Armatimonadota bacterium]
MSRRDITWLAAILVVAAIALHALHFLLFRDLHHTAIYFLGDIAFMPVEVLLVTLVLDRVLAEREKAARRHKMNMVVGVFFSKLGRPLLTLLQQMLCESGELSAAFDITAKSSEREITAIGERVCKMPMALALQPEDMEALQELLKQNEGLTLQLLANPVLLEHEEFTDVLWAIVHLGEELTARSSFDDLPKTDLAHLEGDAERIYRRLLRQWLQYLAHLKQYYPYLYSFAIRANPLHPEQSVEVME